MRSPLKLGPIQINIHRQVSTLQSGPCFMARGRGTKVLGGVEFRMEGWGAMTFRKTQFLNSSNWQLADLFS